MLGLDVPSLLDYHHLEVDDELDLLQIDIFQLLFNRKKVGVARIYVFHVHLSVIHPFYVKFLKRLELDSSQLIKNVEGVSTLEDPDVVPEVVFSVSHSCIADQLLSIAGIPVTDVASLGIKPS